MNHDVFPAVEPASTVFAELRALRQAISGDPRLIPDGDARVRAELLPRRHRDDGAEIERFYWSVQRQAPEATLGFTARTLYADHRLAVPTVHDFPDEPVLKWLAGSDGLLGGDGSGTRVQVLRYVPLRRVTFLAEDVEGLPARVIAKTQRRSSLLRATRVLLAVRRAARRANLDSFAVPRPIRLDAARQLLYLEELPGVPLSQEFERLGATEAMSRLGAIHRTLHELDVFVPGAAVEPGTRDRSDRLRATAVATTRMAVLLPSLRQRMAELYDELVRTVPDSGSRGELAFCQGDFVPSQILCDPSGWSVLDLDDGHYGDPWAEVAALYLALPRELSLKDDGLAGAARGAYLRAYIERAGHAPDPATWRWHLLVAQLLHLARRQVKGRSAPGDAELMLDGIDSGSLLLPA